MIHKQVKLIVAREIQVDERIVEWIAYLNAVGIVTVGSCQGPPPTALIIPSSVDRAVELGYEPTYREDIHLFEIIRHRSLRG